jgi:hypothetical protein
MKKLKIIIIAREIKGIIAIIINGYLSKFIAVKGLISNNIAKFQNIILIAKIMKKIQRMIFDTLGEISILNLTDF